MDADETAALTEAMLNSGARLPRRDGRNPLASISTAPAGLETRSRWCWHRCWPVATCVFR
ncbi:MAG: hypothetical protein R3C05_17615 [Pirellulaceae bacterium]